MKEFTITVFSENKTGLISRIVSVFTRRHINIEILTTSKASIKEKYFLLSLPAHEANMDHHVLTLCQWIFLNL